MPEVDIANEPDPPFLPVRISVVVKVAIGGVYFGEVIGERPTTAEARELGEQILREVRALLQGESYN